MSPHFIFRMESAPEDVRAGEAYQLNDADLASRLSFFLWGRSPDDELVQIANEGRLSTGEVLEQQVRRMLEDPRSEALATRFRRLLAADAGHGQGRTARVLVP